MHKPHWKFFLTLMLSLSMLAAAAQEGSWDFAATVELQSRLFPDDPRWAGQTGRLGQFSLAASAEIRWRNAEGDQRVSLIPYARWDHTDDERSLFDLREAYWAYESDRFELLIGANTVFWGVTESLHLVDVINQTDAVADIDGEQKLGQPMINLEFQRDWGRVGVYLMPFFRERTFASSSGRFRASLPVDSDRPVYQSSAGQSNLDLAIRYSHYFGDFDLGLSVFRGTSREPRLLPDAQGQVLLPHYDQVDQLGVDVQYTRDAWLWKFEGIVRNGYADSYAAAVGGFEYTRYQVRDSDVDVGLLLEYQYDTRGEQEPVTIADNDLFVGTRVALNDTQDTAVLAGATFDVDTGEIFFNVEADRRLGEDYVVELRGRFFAGAQPQDLSYALANDDYLQVKLSRYF